MHACPRCGESTPGAYSEGGLRWAICYSCMDQDRKYRETMRWQHGDEYGDAIEFDEHNKQVTP